MTAAVSLAVVSLGAWLSWARRPRRVGAGLGPTAPTPSALRAPGRPWRHPSVRVGAGSIGRVHPIDVLGGLGRLLTSRFGILAEVAPAPVGAVIVGVVSVAGLGPAAGMLATGAVVTISRWVTTADGRRRRELVEAQLPEVLELLRVGLLSGADLRASLAAIGAHLDGTLSRQIAQVLRRVERGELLEEALSSYGEATGGEVAAAVRQIVGARGAGTPLASAVRHLIDDQRRVVRRRAEERANRLPVLLLLPLVVCVLPAFVLVAVLPAMLAGAGSISLP